MIGVEIKVASGPARPFCEELARRGILCKETHDQVIRFAPPLVVEKEALAWALGEVKEVLA
jgi:ornithine--oxo-acid transaminase